MCSLALCTGIGVPNSFPTPITKAISSSKSNFWVLEKTGLPSGGLTCPLGRLIGVPETIIEDERP